MERTREKERNVRDSRLLFQERPQNLGKVTPPKPVEAYELALRCYLAAPSHLTAYALRAADIARMESVRTRLKLPTTPNDVRLIPPKANGKFNVHFFDK